MKRFITWFLLPVLLSGCATFGRWGVLEETDVERALEANNFSKALDLIGFELSRLEGKLATLENQEGLSEEQKQQRREFKELSDQWTAVQQQTQKSAEDYQIKQLSRVRTLISESAWGEATRIINALLSQVPNNEKLSNAREDFTKRRIDYIENIELDLAVTEAKHLPVVLPLYERLAKADPENEQRRQQWVANEHRRDVVVLKLRKYADNALANKRPSKALGYLSKIQTLVNTPEIVDEINQVRSSLSANRTLRTASKSSSQANIDSRRKEREQAFDEAVQRKRWLDAMDVLTSMMMVSPDDVELLEKQQYLHSVFDKEVDHAKLLGEQFYSAGEIEKALETWQSVRAMAPDDPQLQSNIERAQRILQKVESLKGSDAQ